MYWEKMELCLLGILFILVIIVILIFIFGREIASWYLKFDKLDELKNLLKQNNKFLKKIVNKNHLKKNN